MRRLLPILRLTIPAIVLFALALTHNLGEVAQTPFHRDESRWVGRAYFLKDLLTDPRGSTWDDSDLTRNQPPLGSYLMGLGLTLQGRDTDTTVNNRLYDFRHDFQWNVDHGRQPAGEDILAGRRTNAVVGALLAVTVFFIGQQLAGLIGGTLIGLIGGAVASVFLIYNPLSTHMSSWAGADGLLALTVALAGLTAIRLADRPGWGKAILLGVLLGLGAATKLSPLFVAALVGAAGGALLIGGQPWVQGEAGQRQQSLGWMLITCPFVALATLVASYPYLWSSPIRNLGNMLAYREDEMVLQAGIPAMGTPGWDSIGVDGGLPDAMSRTRFWLGDALSTGRVLGDWLDGRFDWPLRIAWLDLTLGVAGIGILAMMVLLNGPVSRAGAALLLLLGQTVVIWIGMQADFDRYQLPVLVAVLAGLAVAVGATLQAIRVMVSAGMRRLRARESRRWSLPSVPWRRSVPS